MTFVETFNTVLLANALTIAIIYGFWRVKRDENSIPAMLWLIVPCLIVAGIGFAARWENQRTSEAAEQSLAPAPVMLEASDR